MISKSQPQINILSLCSPIARWDSHLEMFASTQDLKFVQGQSRDVPDRKLVLNINISLVPVTVFSVEKGRVLAAILD